MLASATGNTGGVSTMMKSYLSLSESKKDLNVEDATNSVGFGAMVPAGSIFRLSMLCSPTILSQSVDPTKMSVAVRIA